MANSGLVRSGLCAVLLGCVDPVTPPGTWVEQAATACADGPTIRGMDVSYYEDSIDWIAAHHAGIDFAFVRVSDGMTYIDPRFPGYWAGARAAGVLRGAYQFFRPAEDPIAQADLLLDRMGPLQPGDLPPVIDVEVAGELAIDQVAARVRTWVAHVTARIGRPPIVYAGLYSWHDLTGSANLTSSPLWVAQYTSAPCPNIPTPWTRWMFWQTTDTGSIAGVPGAMLDLDVYNGTIDDLRDFAVGGTCGDGRCSAGETTASCVMDCPPCGTIAPDGGTIDDGDACFVAGGPAAYLRPVTGAGLGGDLIWTHATPSASEANFAQWNLFFAEAGRYRVEAYTAHRYAMSQRAAYTVQAAGATTTLVVDQTAADGWQLLGDVTFAAGGEQWIHLGDNTGEAVAAQAQLVFDAIRLTRRTDAPGPRTDEPSGTDEPATDGLSPERDGAGCAAGPGAGLLPLGLGLGLGARRRRGSRARRDAAPHRKFQSSPLTTK